MLFLGFSLIQLNLMKDISTPFETGEYLNVRVQTIYLLAREGKIPGRKVGGRWRFSKAALEQ